MELVARLPGAGEAERALDAAILHARRAGDERAEASALHLLVGVALFGPTPVEEARRRCEEILESNAHKLRVTASALRALAGLAAQQGRFEEASTFMARDRVITEELGVRLTAAAAAELYGWILMLEDDLPAAEAEVRRGLGSLHAMGDRATASTLAALLAQVLYAQGRLDEVLELTALGRDESSPDDLQTQIQWRGPRAKALAGRSELDEAERLARDAVELADSTDFLNVRAAALLDLAEVLGGSRAGRTSGSRRSPPRRSCSSARGTSSGRCAPGLSSSRDPSPAPRRGRRGASRPGRCRPAGSRRSRWRRRR